MYPASATANCASATLGYGLASSTTSRYTTVLSVCAESAWLSCTNASPRVLLSATGLGEYARELGFHVAAGTGKRQRCDHLLGTLGAGIELRPEPRRLEREIALTREERHLGRAARELGVLRIACSLEVRARRERRRTALQGDVADQNAINELGGQAALRGGSRLRWRRRQG